MDVDERVLIMDYGGQYTHLISRRCRELGVYTEIVPQHYGLTSEDLETLKGVILSGGPRRVSQTDMTQPFDTNMSRLSKRGIPALGICFGHQLLAVSRGAKLAAGGNPEYGKTSITVLDQSSILKGLQKIQDVWMSHGDEVKELPEGMKALALSKTDRIASYASDDGLLYGIQFHPEVTHTPNGLAVLRSFLREVCRCTQQWSPTDEIDNIVDLIQKEVGNGRVLMGTSGGVDSTVAAYLIKNAIGDRLYCVFIDNGLLRFNEREEVVNSFKSMGFDNFICIDASKEFISNLEEVEDPETKREIIANTFIKVFERTAKDLEMKHGHFEFLGQGTIYPDRVESAATGTATAVIKSHHNVKLPEWMKFRLVEPLKDLYKDEVRRVGHRLGIPESMINRQPFPGPSLAVRIGGRVTEEQLDILRHADRLLQEELMKTPLYSRIWQSFCVLLPIRSVGVMGDERTYEQVAVIRIVESTDAMTASVSTPDWNDLLRAASRIANEVRGINRVVYDLTSKPPGTIEWY